MAAYTHTVQAAVITTPTRNYAAANTTYTGDTNWSLGDTGVVPANGAGANTVAFAFAGADVQSIVLQATVPCAVTFTGTTGPVVATLVANVPTQITSIAGTCSAISIGANTEGAGPAGTITIDVLYNS